MNSMQLDLWPGEVAALPWGGLSPRLVIQVSIHERLKKFAACTGGVDKSSVCCRSREAQRFDVDPAQYMLCVSTSFKEVS